MKSDFSIRIFLFILLLSPLTIAGSFQNVFAQTPGEWTGEFSVYRKDFPYDDPNYYSSITVTNAGGSFSFKVLDYSISGSGQGWIEATYTSKSVDTYGTQGTREYICTGTGRTDFTFTVTGSARSDGTVEIAITDHSPKEVPYNAECTSYGVYPLEPSTKKEIIYVRLFLPDTFMDLKNGAVDQLEEHSDGRDVSRTITLSGSDSVASGTTEEGSTGGTESGADYYGYSSWDEYCKATYGYDYSYDAENNICVTLTDQDSDNDAIDDSVDQCIGLLEDYYGENDEDGCPEKDSDGDNIYDYLDACINLPEDHYGENLVDGCPEKDSDGDNIYDFQDLCPDAKEDLVGEDFEDGCPENDGDEEPPEEWDIPLEEPPEEWLANLQVNKGSVTITAADGTVVDSNELEIGQTIQTGENADTNVKIALENGDVINLQENTKLGIAEITLSEEEYAAMEAVQKLFEKDVMEKINKNLEKKYGVTLSEEEYAAMEATQELFEKDVMEKINKNLEKLNVPLSEEEMTEIQTSVFLKVREEAKKSSIVDQVNEALSPILGNAKLSEEEMALYSTAFLTGMILAAPVYAAGTVLGGALVVTGYVIMIGGVYYETDGTGALKNQSIESFTAYALDEKNNSVIFTPNALLIPHGTEFTVTVEDGATKLNVLEGEVSVVPYDANQSVTTITSGNSILISDNKVEEIKLDTTSVDKWWEVSAEQESKSAGGCLIATATFDSELAPQVQFLREIRDSTVLSTQSGASFMTTFNEFYYSFSPTVADLERQNPVFKEIVKLTITPLLSSLSLLQYVDIDSEAEMLGYGIGIILLNIGMYFIGPAFLIVRLKSRFSKVYA